MNLLQVPVTGVTFHMSNNNKKNFYNPSLNCIAHNVIFKSYVPYIMLGTCFILGPRGPNTIQIIVQN